MLTDSHCHLDGPKFRTRLPEVAAAARAAGVTRVLTVSSEVGDARRVVEVARELRGLFDGAWAAVGVHPHQAALLDDAQHAAIRTACSAPEVVAVGEIGLDYHYDHSPRDAQQEAFRRQIRLARELALPIVVHSREAEQDTARILQEELAPGARGVLHCFTSSRWLADAAVEMGLAVSFSGILTFPSAGDLREIAAALPASALLVETDAPYLAPVPHRGRTCEPAHVGATASALATLRNVPLETLAAMTSETFERTFLA